MFRAGRARGDQLSAYGALQRPDKFTRLLHEIATTIAAAVEEQDARRRRSPATLRRPSKEPTNITGVAEAATVAGAASSQVLSSAGDLSRNAETLRMQVDGFIAKVREA